MMANILYNGKDNLGVLGTPIGIIDDNEVMLCVGDVVSVQRRNPLPYHSKYTVIVVNEDEQLYLFGLMMQTKYQLDTFIEKYSIVITKSHKDITNDDKDYISYNLSISIKE